MAEEDNGWHEGNSMVFTKEEASGHGNQLDFEDWKGRPCNSDELGGVKAAAFILVAQGFDVMALIAVQNNLIRYLYSDMHFSVSESANAVTNFVGTANLLSLPGGLLSDSFLTRFKTMSIFSFVEMMGYLLLTVQAYFPSLKPPRCSMDSIRNKCKEADGVEKGVMFLALYLIALGSGFIKSNFLAHGADQFDQRIPHQKKMLFNFFNWAYFGICLGSVIALTLLVWVQDNVGRFWGFGTSASAMVISFLALILGNSLYRNKIPKGSPLTRILQVLVAAFRNRKSQLTEEEKRTGFRQQSSKLRQEQEHIQLIEEKFALANINQLQRFLNKAAFTINRDSNPWHSCSIDQVEESRAFLRILPIFGSTIVMNCAIAQLQTFSVQQGSTMQTSFTKDFKVPPASLGAIPLVVLIFLVPFYDLYFIPFARHFTGHPAGIPALHRTGFGLILSAASMAVAAIVETKRRTRVTKMPITYLLPQFFLSALAEFLTRVGLVEFFYSQSPPKMRSMSVALNSFSVSLGYFMSSLLVSLTNWATKKNNAHFHSSGGWLSHNDLNEDHLNWFYWLLCIISGGNFFCYVLCVLSYTNNSGSTSKGGPLNSEIAAGKEDDILV